MLLWILIGAPAYLALCIGVGKFMAFGMGSTSETVNEVWERAHQNYARAKSSHHGQREAFDALRDAMCARLKVGA